MSKVITLEYIRTSILPLCYDDSEIQALIDRIPSEGVEAVLLSIHSSDARRVLAGLLPRAQLVEWANNCAERAKKHAAAYAADVAYAAYAARAADAAANAAADVASAYAANAADAAADAAAYASYAAANADAEHKLAVQDAIRLLDWR